MTSSIELKFSRRAEANIRNVLQYTRATWGNDQENSYLQRLSKRLAAHRLRKSRRNTLLEERAVSFAMTRALDTPRDALPRIQQFAEIGKVANEARPNLREYQLEHLLILYRREPNAVTNLTRDRPEATPPLDSP
jgi:plasmid stabilization system protein ParE